MPFASYDSSFAAKDVETTSEVEESKDYGSGSSVAELDLPRPPSSSVYWYSEHSDVEDILYRPPPGTLRWSIAADDPWSPLSLPRFNRARDNDNVMAKLEKVDYAEDLMQNIRSRVLKVRETRQSTRLEMYLFVSCNVREFMEKQFDGSNESLGRVITLSGTATHGQATTCSDYIRTN